MKQVGYMLIGLWVLVSCNDTKFEQKFVSTDINHFWETYDEIISSNDTALQKQYLNELYIKKGTEGLKALIEVKRYSPEQYLEAINSYPKFWNSIRSNTLQCQSHYAEIEQDIAQLKQLYPDLKPATIYFSMGVFRTNGTIQGDKILIGSEMALSSNEVETSELPKHPKEFNTLYNPVEDIAFLCTHEYVHTQQKELVHNLLTYCIYEGIPEFITTLATGKKPYLSAIEFGENNYERVRDKFEEDIYIAHRTYDWLWSIRKIFGERDLGYAVGFGMAKRYYERAADKQKAIKEMIELDFSNEEAVETFVDASQYLSRPLAEIYESYEQSRPYVTSISGIENGSKEVQSGLQTITIHFSEPLNGLHTSVDYGKLGEATFPKLEGERAWSEDKQSWTITANLDSNKHYQLLVSNNFRVENGIELKPYLIEFWTKP